MQDVKTRLVIPTGRLLESVESLLAEAGLHLDRCGKDYRPTSSDSRFEIKLLKAANIPKLIEFGAHDIGFCGLDWIKETEAQVEPLLDTGLLPVRVVVAGPQATGRIEASPNRSIIVASEYEMLSRRYMESRGLDYRFVRTFGATEVFPPEDADIIVDNVSSGQTLAANGLAILDDILSSTTQFVANREAMEDPAKRPLIDELTLLVKSVLDARSRVLLDMNVAGSRLDAVVDLLPAMRSPTIQPLHGNGAFAVRAAVLKSEVSRLLPVLRNAGATDILETRIQRVLL